MKKLAVFFPGIGYTVDKPLMHYCRRLAAELDYEIRLLPYGGFPRKVKGDRARMEKCLKLARKQSEEMLADLDLCAYDDILFVGKSIGTVAAAEIASASPARDRIRLLHYTPLEETFALPFRNAVVFTGSEDPWVGRGIIPSLCESRAIPCFIIEGANHSLETANIQTDLENLRLIMRESARFLRGNSDSSNQEY